MTVFTPRHGRRNLFALALALSIASLGCAVFAVQASALPAPNFVSGPSPGEVVTAPDVSIGFAVDASLSGGVVSGYQCSVDGAPFTDCASPLDLTNLVNGVHLVEVKAIISLLGGEPLCILMVCIDPGPISIETEIAALPFTVSVAASGTLPPPGGDGANGTNGNDGAAGPGATAGSSAALKRQIARCNKLRRKLKKNFKVNSNRQRVRKRYVRCLKVKRRLEARAAAGR